MTDSSITQREYREEIDALADRIIENQEKYPDDYSDISEAVWETVDGHQWIIYYSYNLDVLRFAGNEPEEWKHLVPDDAGWREVIQKMAYKAMENDVYFAVQDRQEE